MKNEVCGTAKFIGCGTQLHMQQYCDNALNQYIQGIRSVESDADAAKVDVHVVNSNKAHTEKQRKKKRKAKTSTVHQGADNEDSSVQVKGDETQHGSEAVPQAKEQLKAKKKSQPQAPAPANSDKYQSNVQQRALQTEQRPSISKAGALSSVLAEW